MLTKYFRLLFVTTLVVVIGLLIVQTGFAMQVPGLNITLTCTGLSWGPYTIVADRDNTGSGAEAFSISVTDGQGALLHFFSGSLPLGSYPDGGGSGGFNQSTTPQDNVRTYTWRSLAGNGLLEQVVYTTTNSDCTGGSPPPTPVSSFTFTTTDLTANFTDTSSENPTSWDWDFGDGGTSTAQNPSHTYAAGSTYTVCLTASNANGAGTPACQDVTVTEPAPTPTPVSSFTFTTADLTANFTDTSSENPTSWDWDFGDGGSSTAQNPSHTYAAGGTYTVCLTASNANGTGTQACQDVTVTEPAPTPTPVSSFTFTTTDLTANFTDTSSENPTSWDWDFGDGGTSTAQNPSHTYAAGSTYTVCLTASNANGTGTPACQNVTVTAGQSSGGGGTQAPKPSNDSDGDGIPDHRDNCPHTYNPGQEDGWGSALGDACDTDWYNMRGIGISGFKQKNGIYHLHGNCIFLPDGAARCPVIARFDPASFTPGTMPVEVTTVNAGTWSVWIYFLYSKNGVDVYQVNIYLTNPPQPDSLIDDRLEIHVRGSSWQWYQRGGTKQYNGI